MSKGNPVIKKTIVNPSRSARNPSMDQRLSDIEAQIAPFKRMELPAANNGERILEARNIVIPNA
tara:strand:- start:4451 stop:4642 length:192 start_codon:yes stop_codon:yes gene_type:complete